MGDSQSKDNGKSAIPRRVFIKGLGGGVLAAGSISSLAKASAPEMIFGSPREEGVIGPLRLNPASGQLISVINWFTQSEYPIEIWRFQVDLDGATLASDLAQAITLREEKGDVRLHYDYPDFTVEQIMRRVPVKGFAEYVLQVSRKDKREFYVRNVTCGEFQFRNPFEETIQHTDGSILNTPINLFLRSQGGGLILGLAYGYQESVFSKDGRSLKLGYETEVKIPAGELFETEPLFVGTYAFNGLGIFKPFNQVAYRFITSHPEERDLGEIWAMQDYVRTKLPYHRVRDEKQFYMFLNAWWAGKPLAELQDAVDLLARIGVPEVMTRETYYGNCNHVARCEKLENLPDGYRVPLPEQAQKLIAYGKQKGVRLATFVTPTRSFRPEWEFRNNEGKPAMYGEVRSVCFASRDAVEFTLDLWDRMLKEAGSGFFGFDGRILTSFNEVELGFGPIGPLACFASNHGHRPGHNFYQDYKNGQYLFAELRRRNPGVFLEVYWGIKRAMPWAMASFNGCESWYESNGHQDDRMQAWYNQNYRFLPAYQNFAPVKAATDQELRKSVLSAISISSHLQLGNAIKLLDRPANQEFFRKWTGWASQNHRFLNVKRDLFGQPGAVEVDGSAHIIDDRGYIFLFNESSSDRVGSIPLDESIGLTKGKSFDVSQIYPRELTLQRAVKRGQSIAIPVAPSDVVIVALEPASTSTKRLPAIIWHNLGGAELKFAGQQLLITGLQGYQGEQRQIVVQIAGALPKQLLVNGQRIPFATRGNTVLAEVRFGPAPQGALQSMDIKALWEGSGTRMDDSGALVIEKPGLLRSRSKLGSGIYEIDIVCDFSRGGLVFKADPEMQRGVVAAAMFTYFRPVDGNIGFWDAASQAFPLRWTLGGTLKKGHHRFRVETYGSRHAFSIVDPKSGKTLAGPLDYRIETVEAEGLFGVKVDAGSARVTRFAFAPAGLTQAIYPTSRNIDSLVHDAFASRTRTRKFGQKSPAGSRVPLGAAAAIEFDYIKEQEKFRGDDKN